MTRTKKPYVPPMVMETYVQLENAICSGSVIVTNPDSDYGRIDEQQVNTSFDGDFSTFTWENGIGTETTTN